MRLFSCRNYVKELFYEKIVALILAFYLAFALPVESFAIRVGNMEAVNVSESIDELYSERRKLCMDFDANRDAIAAIDRQVAQLGVVELSNEEVLALKSDAALPMVDLPSSSATEKWTSERVYTVYCGVRMQYQIIRGVPNDLSSPLITSRSITVRTEEDFKAGEMVLLKGAIAAASLIHISAGIAYTVLDIIASYNSAIDPETVVDSVACTYTCSLVGEEKYIYVKYDGAPDLDHQFLCYAGNAVDYTIVASIPDPIFVEGEYISDVESVKISGSVLSEKYDNAVAYAVDLFFYYEYLKQKPLIYEFRFVNFTFEGLENIHYLDAPSSLTYFHWCN